VKAADEVYNHGIEEIIGLSVNDQFTMAEWGKFYDPNNNLSLLADADGDLCRAMGLDVDLTGALGGIVRYARATIEVDGGKVSKMHLEDMDGILNPTQSLADHVLPKLKANPKKKGKAKSKGKKVTTSKKK
jgi:peroxiredoxin